MGNRPEELLATGRCEHKQFTCTWVKMFCTYVRDTCRGRMLSALKPSLVQESPELQKVEGQKRLRGRIMYVYPVPQSSAFDHWWKQNTRLTGSFVQTSMVCLYSSATLYR